MCRKLFARNLISYFPLIFKGPGVNAVQCKWISELRLQPTTLILRPWVLADTSKPAYELRFGAHVCELSQKNAWCSGETPSRRPALRLADSGMGQCAVIRSGIRDSLLPKVPLRTVAVLNY